VAKNEFNQKVDAVINLSEERVLVVLGNNRQGDVVMEKRSEAVEAVSADLESIRTMARVLQEDGGTLETVGSGGMIKIGEVLEVLVDGVIARMRQHGNDEQRE